MMVDIFLSLFSLFVIDSRNILSLFSLLMVEIIFYRFSWDCFKFKTQKLIYLI